MSLTPKKFLDASGVQHIADKLNDYPTNELLGTVIDAIGDELEGKADISDIPDNSTFVDLTTNQTIDGQKDFENIPRIFVPGTGETVIVPNNYNQLSYLTNKYPNHSYINTNFTLDYNSKIEIKAAATTIIGFPALCGARATKDSQAFNIWLPSNIDSKIGVNFNNKGAVNSPITAATDTVYVIELNKTHLLINGTNETTITSSSNFTSPGSAYLFDINGANTRTTAASNNYFWGDIYYCKIWDNDVLVRHFIPVQRKNDQVLGMYDIINDVFYPNAGTEMFVAGPYVENHYETLLTDNEFAKVAKTGEYNDLLNKPTIPVVNNATLTIQRNSTTLDTFTANASVNKTINIEVPTDINELSDNSHLLQPFIPTDINDLSDDEHLIPTDISDLTDNNGLLGGGSSFSGDYEDLINTPFIPSDISDLTDEQGLLNGNSGSLSYNDLIDTPFIPTDISELSDNTGLLNSIDTSNFVTQDGLINFEDSIYDFAVNIMDIEFGVFKYKIDPSKSPLATSVNEGLTFYQIDSRPIPFWGLYNNFSITTFFWNDDISTDITGTSWISTSTQDGVEMATLTLENNISIVLAFIPGQYNFEGYKNNNFASGLWLASPDVPINTLLSSFSSQGLYAYIYVIGQQSKATKYEITDATIQQTIQLGGHFIENMSQSNTYTSLNSDSLVLASKKAPNLDIIENNLVFYIPLNNNGNYVSNLDNILPINQTWTLDTSDSNYDWILINNNTIQFAKNDQGLWVSEEILYGPFLLTWEEPNPVYTNSSSAAADTTPKEYLKFGLAKATISQGIHLPIMVDNNGEFAVCKLDSFDLDTYKYFDVCCAVKDNGTIVAFERQNDTISDNTGTVSNQISFEVNNTNYLLSLGITPNYSTLNGTNLNANYFFLMDTTNGAPVFNIPFDIDIYIYYPQQIENNHKISYQPTIQHMISYDFDQLKDFITNMDIDLTHSFELNGTSGWYKISDQPLEYANKDSLMILGQYWDTGDRPTPYDNNVKFFCSSNVPTLINYGLSHSDVNGYDYIQITEDGTNYYPLALSIEDGFYVYLPVIMQNDMINSGAIITYEIENPLIKLLGSI